MKNILLLFITTFVLSACSDKQNDNAQDTNEPTPSFSYGFKSDQYIGNLAITAKIGELSVVNDINGNMCYIKGDIAYDGDVYILREEECVAKVSKKDKLIKITTTNCEDYCGMNVMFDGDFNED